MLTATLILIGLLVCATLAYLLDSVFGKLDFSSNKNIALDVAEIIKSRDLEKAVFYDLGSCRGGFALRIARILPQTKVTGIDDSWFRTGLANIRSIFFNNLVFKKENLFSADISSANVVYAYLPQELMPELELKLKNELVSGATVITNQVSFPDWQQQAQLKQLHIYVKN